jgi:hypothetical protein
MLAGDQSNTLPATFSQADYIQGFNQPTSRPRAPPLAQRERSTSAPNVCYNLVNPGESAEVCPVDGVMCNHGNPELTCSYLMLSFPKIMR